ncbi:MAG: N-acetylmuramoyl-L-alanine amidase [Nitrospira sp.]
MENYLVVPTPNKYVGRRRPLRLIVWHSTESSERQGAAYSVAVNWFAKASSRVSAHIVVDDGSNPRYASGVVECVNPADTAWHCGNANADGYGVEIVGKAAQSGRQWQDLYSLAAIDNACDWLLWNAALRDIPARWLTDAQLKAGQAGHVTHAQVARVLGGSTHTDPGNNFPYDRVMQLLNEPKYQDPPLAYGMRDNPVVRRVQTFLNRRYSYAKGLPATGNYLDLTVRVVKEFQARTGVTGPDANGRNIGPRTWAALRREGYS